MGAAASRWALRPILFSRGGPGLPVWLNHETRAFPPGFPGSADYDKQINYFLIGMKTADK